jgi:hypothetical protein
VSIIRESRVALNWSYKYWFSIGLCCVCGHCLAAHPDPWCVCLLHRSKLYGAIGTHTRRQDVQPNTDHTRSNCQYWTNTCNFSWAQLVTPWWWTLRGPKHVGVYFSVLRLHVFCVGGPLMVAQWLRYCAANRKVAGSIPDGVIGFFHWHKSFRLHYGPGVDSASNRNEYQEYFLGVKAAGA